MKKIKICALAALTLSASIFLGACNKEKNNDSGSSTLQVRMTDAPTAMEEVNVDIREVRVRFTDDSTDAGWTTLATHAGVYNLLNFQNGVDTLVGTGAFPHATLKGIRFVLGANNSVKFNGVVFPLTIPSGSESGLKINLNKALNASLETVVVDFDAAASIRLETNGEYKLRPVLQIR